MRRRRPLVYSLGALLLTSLGVASAQNAYTARPMNLRAGPNRDYPTVAQIDAGAPLDIHGCLDDYSWCDASFEDNRGWIYAGGVSFVYQGQRVPLYSYGPHLGLTVLSFSLMTYWGDYYRGRPFYAQRTSWSTRRMPEHQRPAGRQYSGPPPMHAGRPSNEHSAPRAESGHMAPEHGSMTSEHGHMAPDQGHMTSEHGHMAPASQPHAAPPSTSHGHSSAEHGHAPPAQHGGKPQQRPHAQPPEKHPPSGS